MGAAWPQIVGARAVGNQYFLLVRIVGPNTHFMSKLDWCPWEPVSRCLSRSAGPPPYKLPYQPNKLLVTYSQRTDDSLSYLSSWPQGNNTKLSRSSICTELPSHS